MKAVLQSEPSECGLASLAMVADHHGERVTLQGLRQRYPMSPSGANLGCLMSISGKLGLQCQPLRLDLEQLSQLSTPCILRWDLNHYVVLAKAGRKKATILDPASGKRELSYKEMAAHFTGLALELTPSAEFPPRKSVLGISMRRLIGRAVGLWRSSALLLGLSVPVHAFVFVCCSHAVDRPFAAIVEGVIIA